MKSLVKISAIFIMALFIVNNASAQKTAKQIKTEQKAAAIKEKIDNQNYTFTAQFALPLRGGQKYLTPDYYDLRVVKDSVISFLPFFGRVYMNPPIDPNDAGIKFTSTKFDYKITPKKKGGWTIIIIPNDTKFASKLTLDIYTNGSASLLVNSNTRDQMSFNGYIKEDKPQK